MKKLILALTAVAGFGAFSQVASAQYYDREVRARGDRDVVIERGGVNREVVVERGPKRNLNDGYDRYYNRRRAKTVYIIERGRPVQRVVYVDSNGRYYRSSRSTDVYRERVFESYPERYYNRDGRPRSGVSINF